MTVRELSETARLPTIYDVVPIETEKDCQMYTGENPSRCENQAQYVFVYNQYVTDEKEKPCNCLACQSCVPRE